MKWQIILILLLQIVCTKAYTAYLPPFGEQSYAERISLPHIYPGQTITSEKRFLEDPLNIGSSTVRWTQQGCYGINLDGIHLMRGSYTLIIKSKRGPDIRMLPFETTKIYLPPNYYKIRYDKNTYTVWLGKYEEK